MKGVAFLSFMAFIAVILPNRVEGKCYFCYEDDVSALKCKAFRDASTDGRKKYILENIPGSNCKKCVKQTRNGKVIARTCATEGEGEKAVTDIGGGNIIYACDGDLCNGAESLKSWATLALVATALSFMMRPLF